MSSYTTTATNTYSGNNVVTLVSIANMVSGLPIVFTGNVFGNITANATYYIGTITNSNQVTITSLPGGAVYAVANGTGTMTATFSSAGQYVIDTVPPGDPLDVAFNKTNLNFDQVFAAGPVGSNIQIANNTIRTLDTNGNLVLAPNGIGNVVSNVNIVPNAANIRNLGSPTNRWNTVYAQYIDYSGGNIIVDNIDIPGNIRVGGYISAVGNVSGNYFFGNGSQLTGIVTDSIGNLVISNTTISTKLVNGNILLQSTGTGLVQVAGNKGFVLPAGSTASRPAPSITATIRFNSDTANVEFYNGNQWITLSPTYPIANQTIDGDGINDTFALDQSATDDTVLVTINGVTQAPGLDYAVSGAFITFTTVPQEGDVIQIRFLAGVLAGGSSGSGYGDSNVVILLDNLGSNNISTTGNIACGNLSTGTITLANGATIDDTSGNALAFGRSAGLTTQNINAVAIGNAAGNYLQSANAVAIGDRAGSYTQGTDAVAVGQFAGNYLQGANAVAIGNSAGYTGQGIAAVAIGLLSGNNIQGNSAVAIGNAAGRTSQGANAVAIGHLAGETNQANNSIIINATGVALNQTTANTFTVAPVRNDVANVNQVMFYNTTSREVTYGNTIGIAGNITGGNISVTGNVSGGNVSAVNYTGTTLSATGNVTGSYILGNGSQLTGMPVPYTNANVVALLANFGNNTIGTTGDITGGYFYGNGSQLTGLPGAYSNSNVATFLAAFGSNTISTSGNITSGNVRTLGRVSATGNVSGANISTGGLITATGNVVGNYFIGNGRQLTGIVATSNTGNVTFNNINIIGTGNLHLQPDPANTNSYLDIYLTTGPDLHLVSSYDSNLILGQDLGANVTVGINGNVTVQSWDSYTTTAHTWTFGKNSTLTLPQNNQGGGLGTQQQVRGTQQTILGDPFPVAVTGNATVTVWTADSDAVGAAKMTMRAQYGGSGNPTVNIEILDITMAKTYPNGTPVFTVSNRVKTNPAYADTAVNVALAAGNVMQVTSSAPDATGAVYWTYSVTAFNQTLD